MSVMPEQRCYYEVLSVARTATAEEIKKAYKKLALANHPDRNPGDEEAIGRFKEAAEAYEVLSDDDKRSRYDRHGHAGVRGGNARGPQFQDLGDIFEHFGDLFGGAFGGGGRKQRSGGAQRGAHLQTAITIDLLEASKGCVKDLEVQRKKPCDACSGSGSEPGHTPEQCDYCGGAGQVVQSQGFFRVQTTCPACRGTGKVIRHKCNKCYGSGRENENVTLSVNVPAGIDNGMQLCLKGEGEAGNNGGPRGDLYVDIRVKEHPRFQREGTHLICEVPVSYTQAALGTEIEIPLLEGTHLLKIPAGTQPGEVIRLKGKGLADPRGGRGGDLHLSIKLIVPKNLGEEHERLLRKLAEHEQARVSPHEKSWLEKVKGFFTGDDDDPEEEQ
ncbi:MAG: molecular chaperone DnaJ [Planctomycetaceae bacterium]